MITTRILASVASLAIVALGSSAHAAATFTTVANNGAKQKATLADIYGGTWTTNGRNFTNGTLTATRVADGGVSTPSSLTTGVAGTDDIWKGGTTITAKVISDNPYENYKFGYINDSSSSHPFVQLLNTQYIGSSTTVAIPTNFRWALKDLRPVDLLTSRKSDNSDGCNTYDHMITYRITGGNCDQWILFWQDDFSNCRQECFNDAVIQITRCIPSPGTAVLGLAGMGLLARRRRKS